MIKYPLRVAGVDCNKPLNYKCCRQSERSSGNKCPDACSFCMFRWYRDSHSRNWQPFSGACKSWWGPWLVSAFQSWASRRKAITHAKILALRVKAHEQQQVWHCCKIFLPVLKSSEICQSSRHFYFLWHFDIASVEFQDIPRPKTCGAWTRSPNCQARDQIVRSAQLIGSRLGWYHGTTLVSVGDRTCVNL